MAVKITGGSSTAGQANVTSDYSLQVAPTTTVANAGIVIAGGESGAATDPGGRLARPLEANADYRLRVTSDRLLLWDEYLTPSAQTGVIQTVTSSSTIAYNQSAGGLQLNSGGSTGAGNGAGFGTFKTFKIPADGVLYAALLMNWTAHSANGVWFLGFAVNPTASAQFATYAGIRRTSGGNLELVVRRNSSDIATANIPDTYNVNLYHHVQLGLSNTSAQCWIDGELVAQLSFESGTVAKPFMLSQFPRFCVTQWNENTVTSTAVRLNIVEWSVWDSSEGQGTAAEIAGAAMRTLPYLPRGQGQSSQWTNSGAATSLTLSNTTTAMGAGAAGGNCTFAMAASANTDYLILSWQNDGSVQQGTFMVTGVSVSAVNTGAANSATVPTTLLFGLALNGDAASLAGTDGAATKLPRRFGVGMIGLPVNAVVGQIFDRNIDANFNPIGIDSGSYAALCMRIVSGAATASQVIQLNVQLKGYWA